MSRYIHVDNSNPFIEARKLAMDRKGMVGKDMKCFHDGKWNVMTGEKCGHSGGACHEGIK